MSFMQNKPNLLNTQMNVTKDYKKDYENERLRRHRKNKAKTKPIQSQSKPIKPNTKPIKPNFKRGTYAAWAGLLGNAEL